MAVGCRECAAMSPESQRAGAVSERSMKTFPIVWLMGGKRERKRSLRQVQLRGETYSPTVVKLTAGRPPDDLGGFSDGQTGVREPRPPSPAAPEVGEALEPPPAQ